LYRKGCIASSHLMVVLFVMSLAKAKKHAVPCSVPITYAAVCALKVPQVLGDGGRQYNAVGEGAVD
jgi:hypothetical protein